MLHIITSYYFIYLSGPPEAPREVTIISLAAESVLISWVVGLNGGSQQTFVIEFTELQSSIGNYIKTQHVDPVTDSVIESKISGLNPNTNYQAMVKSKNHFNGGSETSSMDVFFTTRGKFNFCLIYYVAIFNLSNLSVLFLIV